MAAKGEKLAKRALYGEARKHYCPTCPLNQETGDLEPMSAVMVMPGRRIEFRCAKGHTARKGRTIRM
jgi:hypothetical protein